MHKIIVLVNMGVFMCVYVCLCFTSQQQLGSNRIRPWLCLEKLGIKPVTPDLEGKWLTTQLPLQYISSNAHNIYFTMALVGQGSLKTTFSVYTKYVAYVLEGWCFKYYILNV